MQSRTFEGIDPNFISIFDVADMVNQPIHISTPDGIVRFVNKAWSASYGIPLEKAIGRSIYDLVEFKNYSISLPDYRSLDSDAPEFEITGKPTKKSVIELAVEKRKNVTMLNQTPSKNKVLVTAMPIFNDKQEIVMIFTLIQDFTMLNSLHDFMADALKKAEAAQVELAHLRGAVADSPILGNSKEITELRKLISIVAPSDASVLIYGESGTGKEVVAKQIFAESLRNDAPFVSINCAAIPENLLESELFGHEKGSFTGAVSTKMGLFEVANHGTLLLDEIGEIPLSLQPKLLRALQEREIRRVGGNKNISVDVRVIAATNRDLLGMIAEGRFRADLYYRLNVFPLVIPPLKERRDDIPVLAVSFLNKFCSKYNKTKTFIPQAMYELERYSWPGNVRELENVIERLVIVGSDPRITADHVRAMISLQDANAAREEAEECGNDLKSAVDSLERKMISDAIAVHKSTYKAAAALGTSQSTIVRKMKLLGIKRPEENLE